MYTNIFRNSYVSQTADQLEQMSPQGDDGLVCGLQGVQQTDLPGWGLINWNSNKCTCPHMSFVPAQIRLQMKFVPTQT